MDVNGSPEYELTWKEWDMPAGVPICALRASPRHTSASVCTGWRTPIERDHHENKLSGNPDRQKTIQLAHEAHRPSRAATGRTTEYLGRQVRHLAGWPTPTDDNANNSMGHQGTDFADLPTTAQLAGWPTAQARDGKGASLNQQDRNARPLNEVAKLAGWTTPRPTDDNMSRRSPEAMERERERAKAHAARNLALDASLAGWPTPNTPSGGRSVSTDWMDATGKTVDGRKHTASLEHAVKFAGWATPVVTDSSGTRNETAGRSNPNSQHHNGQTLGDQIRGLSPSPSTAPTASGAESQPPRKGRLNCLFSLYLMGYNPVAWASCAARGTQSCRSSRRSSSAPLSKP